MTSWDGELEPISLAQIRQGKGGRVVEIDDDVLNVVKDIKRIDERLHVRWSEEGEYFVVYCRLPHEPPGFGNVVLTSPTLDGRVVSRIEMAAWKQRQPGYSYADELDAVEAEEDAKQDARISDMIAENAARFAYALRKDLGKNDGSIVVARDLKDVEGE